MPKMPPDLPRLLPATDPADRVQVQETAFSHDVLGRYVCNDWAEIQAQIDEGGFPFDAVVIGGGMFGGYLAAKLYRQGAGHGLRILVLDAGAFLFPGHVQNMPRLGGKVDSPDSDRTRDDASETQNVVWGMPWISNEKFPGLAYCTGGRSLFWGGWSPELTDADLDAWPDDARNWLTAPHGYAVTAKEIGTDPTADFMEHNTFHNGLRDALTAASSPGLDPVEEAPLAVQGSSPASGIFPFNKFSSVPWLMDAVREDVAQNTKNTARGDVSRRIFLVPRTQVMNLQVTDSHVIAIDLATNGVRATLPIPASCAVVLAAGTIESTRLALTSLGVGDHTHKSPRLGNLMGHLRSTITVRVKRSALALPPQEGELETTAFLIRGTTPGGRSFHLQISAAAVSGNQPEQNMWQQVPDIEDFHALSANQDPDWIVLILRGIGEMGAAPSLTPDPDLSWIDLSPETDRFDMRRAYVHLVATQEDKDAWRAMDKAAFDLVEALAGDPENIEYWEKPTADWGENPRDPEEDGGGPWRDSLGSTHHEAGTLFMGDDPNGSITNSSGRFHELRNTYVAGPALFPTIGSANPSLTALTLARHTAQTIIKEHTLTPPDGFEPLSLKTANWRMVDALDTSPTVRHLGPILETSGGYGLYWYLKPFAAGTAFWIEWRQLHTGDNSGIYLHAPAPNNPDALNLADTQGYEIQINDGAPNDLNTHSTGAIYNLQAPTSFAANPPGEWNSYLIETDGTRLSVTLNDKPVNEFTGNRNDSGYLALQVHSGTVQFRNLRSRTAP